MKLTILRGGGFAGIVARTELDARALPEPAARAFAGEIARANLWKQPPTPPARRWPDAQLYQISLEEVGEPVNANYTDESLPEDVRLLVAWVDSRPERIESIER